MIFSAALRAQRFPDGAYWVSAETETVDLVLTSEEMGIVYLAIDQVRIPPITLLGDVPIEAPIRMSRRQLHLRAEFCPFEELVVSPKGILVPRSTAALHVVQIVLRKEFFSPLRVRPEEAATMASKSRLARAARASVQMSASYVGRRA